MKKRREANFLKRASFLLGAIALIGPAIAMPQRSAIVRSVNVGVRQGAVKFSLAASQPLRLQPVTVTDGKPVLVFEVSPALLVGGKQVKPVNRNGVRDIRIAQYSNSPSVVRVVADLEHPVHFKSGISQNQRHVYLSFMPENLPIASASSPSVSSLTPTAPLAAAQIPVSPRTSPSPKSNTSKEKISKSFEQKLKEIFVAKAVKKKSKVIKSYSAPQNVSYSWKHADLPDVVRLLADRMHLNVIIDNAVTGSVTLDLKNVPAPQALSMILAINGYGYRQVGNVLVVAAPDKLDKVPSVPVSLGPQAIQVIPLENAKADTIQPTVSKEYPGVKVDVDSRLNALIVRGSIGEIRQVKSLVAELDQPAQGGAPPAKGVFALNYADQKDVVGQIKPLLPSDTMIIADQRLNTLIIIGSQYAIDTARSFISAVDVPSPQVMLEMQVLDVTDEVDRELGIEWPTAATTNFVETAAGEGTPTGISQLPATGGSVPTANSLALQNMGIHTFVRDNIALQAKLHWAITHNKGKLLASPRVATVNNKDATIQLGGQYPYTYFDPRAGSYQIIQIQTGVTLKVTPQISPDGSITIHVNPQQNDITGFTATTPPYPILSTRNADANIRVKNGETILIGGLLQDNNTNNMVKVPLLGDLPIIGEFFRHRTTTHKREDLIITITPTLLANR